MESITIKTLNELLSEKTRSKYLVNEQKGYMGVPSGGEGNQGEYNETFKYYKHNDMPENIFLQVAYQTDSYGDNDAITDIKFVEGKAKQITVYEPSK
jgi:hypothetical protein